MPIAFIICCILFMATGPVVALSMEAAVRTGFVGALLRLYKFIRSWDVEVAVSAPPTESLQAARAMAGAVPADATGLMYLTGLQKYR